MTYTVQELRDRLDAIADDHPDAEVRIAVHPGPEDRIAPPGNSVSGVTVCDESHPVPTHVELDH